MFKGYIYKCTCVISGKSYVGLTTKTIEERKKEHLHSSYNPNDNTYKTHFHSAIRKYGIENFEWSIVEEIEGSDITTVIATLRGLEGKYVAFYDSFHNGYNLTPGGELTFRGEPKVVNMYSEDGILLDTGTVGHLASKYNLDDSAICKVCNRRYKSTGKLNGKRLVFRYTHDKFTASDKKQLASNNKGFKSGKPVAGYSFDTGAELFRFDSVTKAAKALNLDSHSISSCASGKYKYSGKIDSVKIVWKYI